MLTHLCADVRVDSCIGIPVRVRTGERYDVRVNCTVDGANAVVATAAAKELIVERPALVANIIGGDRRVSRQSELVNKRKRVLFVSWGPHEFFCDA